MAREVPLYLFEGHRSGEVALRAFRTDMVRAYRWAKQDDVPGDFVCRPGTSFDEKPLAYFSFTDPDVAFEFRLRFT